jgi:hypothetical protein
LATEGHLLFSIEILISKKQHMMGHKGRPNRVDSLIVERLSDIDSADDGAQNARDWFHVELHHESTVLRVHAAAYCGGHDSK